MFPRILRGAGQERSSSWMALRRADCFAADSVGKRRSASKASSQSAMCRIDRLQNSAAFHVAIAYPAVWTRVDSALVRRDEIEKPLVVRRVHAEQRHERTIAAVGRDQPSPDHLAKIVPRQVALEE